MALLDWGASAQRLEERDRWIGWTGQQRAERQGLVVMNRRFLVPGRERMPNLASKALMTLACRHLPEHWERLHGHAPVLAEIFTDIERFHGACDKAAGWQPCGRVYNTVCLRENPLTSIGCLKRHQAMFHVFRFSASASQRTRRNAPGIVLAVAAIIGAPFLAQTDKIFIYLQKMNGMYFIPNRYLGYLRGQVEELCTGYGPLAVWWWDINRLGPLAPDLNDHIRQPQHGIYFQCDADCAPVTPTLPRSLALQWLDLLAHSGTPLFISADPKALDNETEKAIQTALEIASNRPPLAEPLDWMETPSPRHWQCGSTTRDYNWLTEIGCSPEGLVNGDPMRRIQSASVGLT